MMDTGMRTISSWRTLVVVALVVISPGWSLESLASSPVRALWPSLVALLSVILLRRVITGLLAGACAGSLVLSGGNPVEAFIALFRDHLIPQFESPWKTGAVLFTFMLGGFAALLERGGGLRSLLTRMTAGARDPAQRIQWSGFGLGMICFFDGLANSMMVGRLLQGAADRYGLSRVKLAYIVDSTSSAVACLAFVSTWIAFQLSMIQEGFDRAGIEPLVSPYELFFRSIPENFYCLYTLVLLGLVIGRRIDFGPMAAFEADASRAASPVSMDGHDRGEDTRPVSAATALGPLGLLIVTILAGLYLGGVDDPWPLTADKITAAFGGNHGAIVLVCASAFASIAAFLVYPRRAGASPPPDEVYREGALSLFVPVNVLLCAWMLSSVLGGLGAGDVVAGLLGDSMPAPLFPAAVFFCGAVVSFTTGTSWGTMGILMPLTIPVVVAMGGTGPESVGLLAATVGAVFSGAVFGDHCSPLSDTTIVSSIACGVEARDHVRTQMPYALLAAFASLVCGFLPVGYGVPVVAVLIAGVVLLWLALSFLARTAGRA